MNVPVIVLHPSAQAQLNAFLAAPSHAVLLSGPTGSGKTIVARTLAAELLQITVTELENHAYLRIITPQKGSISIEQTRELSSFFSLKVPGKASIKRAAIIEDADTMGTEAQNALLKLLEEPPADSVLILTSSRPQTLLTTIRSRVQPLHLPSPETSELKQHFTATGHDEQKVTAALLRSGTNIAAAESLLTASDTADTSLDLAKKVLGGTSYDRMLLVDSLSKQKDAAAEFVDTLATVAMASLEAAAARGASTVNRWKDVLQAAHTAQAAFERSGNPKLVLTELMLAL